MHKQLVLTLLLSSMAFTNMATAQNVAPAPVTASPPSPAPMVATTPQNSPPIAALQKPVMPSAANPTPPAVQPLPVQTQVAVPNMQNSTMPSKSAVAVTPTQAATPPLSAQAEAQKLLDTTHAMANAQQISESMANSILSKIISPSMPSQKAETAKQIVIEEVNNSIKEMMPAIQKDTLDLYVKNFTAEELHKINEFYATPVGQKAITLMPKIMQQGMQNGQAEAQKVMPAMIQRIKQRFQSAGI
jgi:hypothetical protein